MAVDPNPSPINRAALVCAVTTGVLLPRKLGRRNRIAYRRVIETST
jgi:hypothetical protein